MDLISATCRIIAAPLWALVGIAVIPLVYRGVRDRPLRAHVEAQGGLGRKDGKLTVGIWLGLSTGWATVAINRPPAALGSPHAPWYCYPYQGG